jgi:hypothetical protein
MAFLEVTLVQTDELLIEGPLKADTVDTAKRAHATAVPFTILVSFSEIFFLILFTI